MEYVVFTIPAGSCGHGEGNAGEGSALSLPCGYVGFRGKAHL
jgi:hypothetical protein